MRHVGPGEKRGGILSCVFGDSESDGRKMEWHTRLYPLRGGLKEMFARSDGSVLSAAPMVTNPFFLTVFGGKFSIW